MGARDRAARALIAYATLCNPGVMSEEQSEPVIIERETAEYIRDFSEELALMADGIKLAAVARALQTAALLAQNAADRLGSAERKLRPKRKLK